MIKGDGLMTVMTIKSIRETNRHTVTIVIEIIIIIKGSKIIGICISKQRILTPKYTYKSWLCANRNEVISMKRDRHFKVRMTEEELKDLNLKVKQSKMSREEFVRLCIKNVTVKEPPSLDYYRLINEFNRIGTNLNQLTKLAHVSIKLPDHQLENILNELSLLIKKVDKEIQS